jgi:GH15 family glucan-1,4-alpha-glucosidase
MVDSVGGVFLALPPESGVTVDVWVACGESYSAVRETDRALRREGVSRLLARTRAHWGLWSATGELDDVELPEDVARLYRRSLWVLRLHQDRGGALLSGLEPAAAGRSHRDRRFAWLRDGAVAADALGRAGYGFLARRYFEFCARATREAGRPAAIFTADGSIGAAPRRVFTPRRLTRREEASALPPASLDGMGLHLWALARHFERERDVEFLSTLFEGHAAPLADALIASLDAQTRLPGPAFDPWEERVGQHASVAAAVIGGLRSAARLAVGFGAGDRARRWAMAADEVERALVLELCPPGLGRFARSRDHRGEEARIDATLDASLLWISLFGDLEPEDARVRATVEAVRARLWVESGPGGLLPHEVDPAAPVEAEAASDSSESPSLAATLWLALHTIRTARRREELDAARTILFWAAARTGATGLLPERLPAPGAPADSPAPSMPAHAWFVETVAEFVERTREIQRCERCGAPARTTRARGDLVKARLPGLIARL